MAVVVLVRWAEALECGEERRVGGVLIGEAGGEEEPAGGEV